MPPSEDVPQRKRRTREHVIADLSQNHLERKVLSKGHILRRPERDYGVDVSMFHFAEDGQLENGEVRFQLKATDNLKTVNRGKTISFPLSAKDLHYWGLEIYPFILIVFDAKTERAYWLHIQEYLEGHPQFREADTTTVHVHIPISNKLTVKSVDFFRKKSLQVVENFERQGGFRNATRKPR